MASSARESAPGSPETTTTTLLEAVVEVLLHLKARLLLARSVEGRLTKNFFEVLMVHLDHLSFNAR